MVQRHQPPAPAPAPVPATATTPDPAAPDKPSIAPPAAARRVQPPLKEVLKGLDARELEGPTVFDQLFGPKTES